MENDHDPQTGEHVLALGGTRPALLPGLNIPWVEGVLYICAGLMAFVWTPQYFFIVWIPFMAFMVRLYRKDYNAGRVLLCWASVSARHLAVHAFGGSFVHPNLLKKTTFRGIISAD
jgi:type IV secretory pathway VirB3-like protein